MVEPWYLAYALLGATAAGLMPILLPLIVSHRGSAVEVGLVMAALSVGGLTAPLWGELADRYRLHRWLLGGGLLLAAIGVAVFPFARPFGVWLGLALLQGIGLASTGTVANLFVVEAHPQAEWDARIGWLQAFYGGGRVGGLLLAGALAHLDQSVGLLVTAGLLALGVLAGLLTTRTPTVPLAEKPALRHSAWRGEWAPSSPQGLFYHLTLDTLRRLRTILRSRFVLFLAIWLAAFIGSSAVFSFYPVMMEKVFDIGPRLSSSAFAVSAGLGLVLYPPAARWSDNYGPARVFEAALGFRALSLLGMLVLGLARAGRLGDLVLVAFGLLVISWSPLIVAGTALTARLSAASEGEGMGVFNGINALAGVMGAVLGGWAAGRWGYNAVSGLGVIAGFLGFALAAAVRLAALHDQDTRG